jgi:hypothetical protein
MSSQHEIAVVSPVISNRLKYVVHVISSRLGLEMPLVSENEFDGNLACISYSTTVQEGRFTIFANGLLSETGISSMRAEPCIIDGMHCLYPAPAGFDLPFDLFSACFLMLSRYEEYVTFSKDVHGRFEADQSMAFRNGFLEEPVVDQWIWLLKNRLSEKFPSVKIENPKYQFLSTFDIDHPWAFLHKGFYRISGGLVKDLLQRNFDGFWMRLKTLMGLQKDPYDVFDYIQETERKHHFRSAFFFLLGDYDRVDPNYAWDSNAFKKLVAGIQIEHVIGIHPSVRSTRNTDILKKEQERFVLVSGNIPVNNRQHFLIVHFPDTYRRLSEHGIRADYSMGFASHTGFRAGTCTPYLFYDLASEKETDLVIFPFAVMDVTLMQYMGLTPDEAIAKIRVICDNVRASGGTFSTLWHNESLSEVEPWKGWRKVFESMVGIAK